MRKLNTYTDDELVNDLRGLRMRLPGATDWPWVDPNLSVSCVIVGKRVDALGFRPYREVTLYSPSTGEYLKTYNGYPDLGVWDRLEVLP